MKKMLLNSKDIIKDIKTEWVTVFDKSKESDLTELYMDTYIVYGFMKTDSMKDGQPIPSKINLTNALITIGDINIKVASIEIKTSEIKTIISGPLYSKNHLSSILINTDNMVKDDLYIISGMQYPICGKYVGYDCGNQDFIFEVFGKYTTYDSENQDFAFDVFGKSELYKINVFNIIDETARLTHIIDDETTESNSNTYHGPTLTINYTDPFNESNICAIRDVFHNAFVGNRDYVDSNIIVSDNNGDAEVTICLDDITDGFDFRIKMHKLIHEFYDKYFHSINPDVLCDIKPEEDTDSE